jgi:hypothetical protein
MVGNVAPFFLLFRCSLLATTAVQCFLAMPEPSTPQFWVYHSTGTMYTPRPGGQWVPVLTMTPGPSSVKFFSSFFAH